MKKIFGEDAARSAIYAKKYNEFELANAIRRHFDTGALSRDLNDMVAGSSIFAEMLTQNNAFQKTWDDNSWMDVRKAYPTIRSLQDAAIAGRVKALHCGDWIRIFGEIAEKVPDMNTVRVDFQVGGDEFWLKKKGISDHMPMIDLITGEFPDVDPGTRVRLGTGPKRLPGGRAQGQKLDGFFSGDRVVHFRSFEKRSDLEKKQLGGGMTVWSPQERDILYRIESAFGLRVGATISGTTTDTLYFLSVFGGLGMDPIFYLLPFATIAAPGHHSLIEVAMPLALNDKIDYSIGYYTSLLPQGSTHTAVSDMKKTLAQYEHDMRNRKMIVWFKTAEVPGGYWQVDPIQPGEIRTFTAMAKIGRPMMQQFSAMRTAYMFELDLLKWYRNARRGNPRTPIH